jgi:hypothetical protein
VWFLKNSVAKWVAGPGLHRLQAIVEKINYPGLEASGREVIVTSTVTRVMLP